MGLTKLECFILTSLLIVKNVPMAVYILKDTYQTRLKKVYQ
jgi:hypothetical protein